MAMRGHRTKISKQYRTSNTATYLPDGIIAPCRTSLKPLPSAKALISKTDTSHLSVFTFQALAYVIEDKWC